MTLIAHKGRCPHCGQDADLLADLSELLMVCGTDKAGLREAMKNPTEYRIVYVFHEGLRYVMGYGGWWPIIHDDTRANHITLTALAGELFDIEVR